MDDECVPSEVQGNLQAISKEIASFGIDIFNPLDPAAIPSAIYEDNDGEKYMYTPIYIKNLSKEENILLIKFYAIHCMCNYEICIASLLANTIDDMKAILGDDYKKECMDLCYFALDILADYQCETECNECFTARYFQE